MVYAPRDRSTFAVATAVLDELGLNIADARIIRLGNGFTLSTYIVLENGGEQIGDASRRDQILRRLEQGITAEEDKALRVTRRPPRQVRMFSTPTIVSFASDESNDRTVMEIVAGDRPGILCQVGQVLRHHKVAIQAAKIVTVGERAEDVFYVTDQHGAPLSAETCAQLKQAVTQALDSPA